MKKTITLAFACLLSLTMFAQERGDIMEQNDDMFGQPTKRFSTSSANGRKLKTSVKGDAVTVTLPAGTVKAGEPFALEMRVR